MKDDEREKGFYLARDFRDTELVGEIKSATGIVDPKLIKAIERLMAKHKVNYIHLFWGRFK